MKFISKVSKKYKYLIYLFNILSGFPLNQLQLEPFEACCLLIFANNHDQDLPIHPLNKKLIHLYFFGEQ